MHLGKCGNNKVWVITAPTKKAGLSASLEAFVVKLSFIFHIKFFSTWATQVIGTGEYALDIIIDYMVGNE
jgi:hypothetical protein